MKHYKLKTGKGELNSTSGNHLCGLVLGNLSKTTLPSNFQPRRSDAIADREILLSQIGLLCNGRNDFNDIDLYRGDEVFMNAYGLEGRCLFRLDSGNDAAENFTLFGDNHFLVKRNLRKESREQWLALARRVGDKQESRDGKNVYTGFVDHLHPGGDESRPAVSAV